jgi:hypothetical protein
MSAPDDNEVIEDVAPNWSANEPCDVADGAVDICWDDDNYATCDNGSWVVRACAPGTTCQEDFNGQPTCA